LTEEEKWTAGVNLIANLGDLESAERLRNESNNYYRLQRVVDILLQSPGKTLKDLNLNEAAPLDFDFRCYFLTRPRVDLYRRIDSRVEDIVSNGVIAETTRELLKRGLQANRNCSTRAIGYRQVLEYLEKARTNTNLINKNMAAPIVPLSESGIVQLAREIQSASRQLCHKQVSWFRDDPLFKWIDASQGEKESVDQILELYETPAHQGGCGAQFNGGRLTKEEEKMMKTYVTKFEKLVPGSDGIKKALTEAKEALLVESGSGVVENGVSLEEEEPALKKSKT
jgi:tRNA dimethylallyltransferase